MRSLLLEIGPAGEIKGAMVLTDCEGDQAVVQAVLDRILKKENPGGEPGAEPGTDNHL